MKTALICALCLCALLLLSGCGATAQPLVRTDVAVVEVPVTKYVPVPAELTKPLVLPARPPANCRQRTGAPAICGIDLTFYIEALKSLIDRANEDRKTAANLSPVDKGPAP